MIAKARNGLFIEIFKECFCKPPPPDQYHKKWSKAPPPPPKKKIAMVVDSSNVETVSKFDKISIFVMSKKYWSIFKTYDSLFDFLLENWQ